MVRNKNLIYLILNYLIMISHIFGDANHNFSFNYKVKYFFKDKSRYGFLDDKGSYIKKELKKINANFIKEFGQFPLKETSRGSSL